jgi:hypothetical protein
MSNIGKFSHWTNECINKTDSFVELKLSFRKGRGGIVYREFMTGRDTPFLLAVK